MSHSQSKSALAGSMYNYYVSRLLAPDHRYGNTTFFSANISKIWQVVETVTSSEDIFKTIERFYLPARTTGAMTRVKSAQDGKHEEVTFPERFFISISLYGST